MSKLTLINAQQLEVGAAFKQSHFKCYHLHQFQVDSSVALSIFTVLCSHRHHPS